MSSDPSNTDSYALSRDHNGAARLNYQHYLWKETLKWNVHPSIPLSPSSEWRIADVACGTGLWVAEVARSLPRAQVDGFDVSLSHSPPPEWQPGNSQIIEWDMFSEPDPDWVGAYDLVHIRLIQIVVADGDPLPVLRQAARLLRPGGYFQWDELDTGGSYVLRTERCLVDKVPLPTMDHLVGMLAGFNPWIGRLKGSVESMPEKYFDPQVYTFRDPKHTARAFFDMHLGKDEELANTSYRDTPLGEKILQNVQAMLEESKHGAVLCTPKLVLVCRRTEEEEEEEEDDDAGWGMAEGEQTTPNGAMEVEESEERVE